MNPYPGETIRQIVAGERGGVPVLPIYTGGDMNAPAPAPKKRKPFTLRTLAEILWGGINDTMFPIIEGGAAAGAAAGTVAGGGSLKDAAKAAGEAAKNPTKAPEQVGQEMAGPEGATSFWMINGLLILALVIGGLMLLQQTIPTPVGRLLK